MLCILLLTQLCFIVLAFVINKKGFLPDNFMFIALALFGYIYYDKLKINSIILALANSYFALHAFGVLDFYNLNFFSIPFDKIIHFYGFFIIGIMYFNLFRDRFKGFSFFWTVILCAAGIGSLVEVSEYLGYVFLGEGPGFLMYGPGDGMTLSDKFSNSWQNSATDMIANTTGAIAGFIFMQYIPISQRRNSNKSS